MQTLSHKRTVVLTQQAADLDTAFIALHRLSAREVDHYVDANGYNFPKGCRCGDKDCGCDDDEDTVQQSDSETEDDSDYDATPLRRKRWPGAESKKATGKEKDSVYAALKDLKENRDKSPGAAIRTNDKPVSRVSIPPPPLPRWHGVPPPPGFFSPAFQPSQNPGATAAPGGAPPTPSRKPFPPSAGCVINRSPPVPPPPGPRMTPSYIVPSRDGYEAPTYTYRRLFSAPRDVQISIHWIGRGTIQVIDQCPLLQSSICSKALELARSRLGDSNGFSETMKDPSHGLSMCASLKKVRVGGVTHEMTGSSIEDLGPLFVGSQPQEAGLPGFEVEISSRPVLHERISQDEDVSGC